MTSRENDLYKSLLGIEGQRKLEKFAILAESLRAILEY